MDSKYLNGLVRQEMTRFLRQHFPQLEGAEEQRHFWGASWFWSMVCISLQVLIDPPHSSHCPGKNKKKNPILTSDTHILLFNVFLEKTDTYFKVILELFSF